MKNRNDIWLPSIKIHDKVEIIIIKVQKLEYDIINVILFGMLAHIPLSEDMVVQNASLL